MSHSGSIKPPTHYNQPTLSTQNHPAKEEKDLGEENILLSTPDPTSLTQDKALLGDIMCCVFYTRDTDLILDVHITDADNSTKKINRLRKYYVSMVAERRIVPAQIPGAKAPLSTVCSDMQCIPGKRG